MVFPASTPAGKSHTCGSHRPTDRESDIDVNTLVLLDQKTSSSRNHADTSMPIVNVVITFAESRLEF